MNKNTNEAYLAVMDSSRNPFQFLSLTTQFKLMSVLAWMWSMVFSLSFLSIFHFQWVWLAHFLLLSATFTTIALFKYVQKHSTPNAGELSDSRRCVWKIDSEA